MKIKTLKPVIKHAPQRTCVACRQTNVKRELVRLVQTPEVGVDVDLTGKKSGRGAYLCPALSCWQIALETGRLEHALKTRIGPENKEKLVNYAKEFDNTNNGLGRSEN
jgi:uncharacterized protein